MGVKFISGFRGYDNAKQGIRRSVHAGSELTSGGTVLNPSQAFDSQACFVYLNGAMLREGNSGAGGDYVLTGTSTITFNVAVASAASVEVISYNFANPTLPETMIETNTTISSAQSSEHATAVTGASYAQSTDTITKTGAFTNNSVGDVISVTTSPTTNSLATGRYLIKTRTSANAVVLEAMDYSALTFSADSASANINFSQVFSQKVNNLTLINKVMLFLNGMLLVENTDYYRDQQNITMDSTVALQTNAIVAIRNFGSFVFPTSSEVQNSSITIADEGIATLLTSDDLTANVTAVFNLHVSARHATAANDAYRSTNIYCRAEVNVASDCYLHLVSDAGNINTGMELKDAGTYSSISSFTDGKIGIGVTANSDRWSIIMGNRSSHSIVAGFKAIAITN